MKTFQLLFLACLLCGLDQTSPAAESGYDRPMGPLGGYHRLTGGQNYVRVSSLATNTVGYAAGLRVNDFIHGAFGEEFGVTPPGDSVWNGTGFQGAVQDFGLAIERAEEGDGLLPLKVLRAGVGDLTIVVPLKGTNALGPAYPLNSPKYNEWYEVACSKLYSRLMGNTGDYLSPYTGLALMGHPGALQTNGPTPYRLALDKMRDAATNSLATCVYAPVEDALLDGTPNPNRKGGMSNWQLGPRTMFLAEYMALKPGIVFEDLLRLNEFFAGGGRERPFVPVKERSLQIFGDEKRLDALRGTTLFKGRLTLDQLRCFVAAEPLGWQRGPNSTGPVLVIENAATWDTYYRWNRKSALFSAVVYGCGNRFADSVARLADIFAELGGHRRILYFGDLDPQGLRIPQLASARATSEQLPSVEPHLWSYAKLLAVGRGRETPMGDVEPATATDFDWLGELAAPARVVLSDGKRLAQENLGWEFLMNETGDVS